MKEKHRNTEKYWDLSANELLTSDELQYAPELTAKHMQVIKRVFLKQRKLSRQKCYLNRHY